MHPWYKSDKPGIAPDCGMKLVPVYEGEQAQYDRSSRRGCAPAPSRSRPEKQQLIGVEYGTAEYRIERRDHPRRRQGGARRNAYRQGAQPKIEGWIDQVFADFTGKYVREGPAAAHHLQSGSAGHAAGISAGAEGEGACWQTIPCSTTWRGSQDTLLAAARKRLELWDISDEQIDAASSRPESRCKNLTLYAPISGFVTERNAFPEPAGDAGHRCSTPSPTSPRCG